MNKEKFYYQGYTTNKVQESAWIYWLGCCDFADFMNMVDNDNRPHILCLPAYCWCGQVHHEDTLLGFSTISLIEERDQRF